MAQKQKSICLYFNLENNFNTLRQTQNGSHFPDGIFKYTFFNESKNFEYDSTEVCS